MSKRGVAKEQRAIVLGDAQHQTNQSVARGPIRPSCRRRSAAMTMCPYQDKSWIPAFAGMTMRARTVCQLQRLFMGVTLRLAQCSTDEAGRLTRSANSSASVRSLRIVASARRAAIAPHNLPMQARPHLPAPEFHLGDASAYHLYMNESLCRIHGVAKMIPLNYLGRRRPLAVLGQRTASAALIAGAIESGSYQR